MSIRVTFEVGHSATVKGKTTVEGFTHDWELFVRGESNSNISRFVEKVIFNLHDSFPKPKRGKWSSFVSSNITSKLAVLISFVFIYFDPHIAVVKDPPYSLKECGYAGFELDIDIYFKCQRDEQKKITFRYDLTLPSKGSTSVSERRSHTFVNPSSEFRRKLLEGGGLSVYPNTASNDDRSRDAIEGRTQLLSKPKLGSISSSGSSDTKKHKSKSSQDDIVMKPSSTFATLFGTPITKLSNSKQSPEQKISNNSGSSSSNNTKLPSSSSSAGGGGSALATASASSGNSNKQISQKSSASSSSKDKSDKSSKSKKEKNKVSSSPMKDGKESASSKKSTVTSGVADDKHQRRDDVRKEKSHIKDRERGKDKPSKRPASPKALAASRSPKRSASPSSRNSSSNRHLTEAPTSATQAISSARLADDKASNSSSTNKKSKKEKRDKSFEKERERGVDGGKKDGKSMPPTTNKQPKDEKPLSKSLEKINGTSKRDREGAGGSGNSTPKDSLRDKSSTSSTIAKYRQVFDAKIDSPVEPIHKSGVATSGVERENKKGDKHDGSDRKHKHKKKDKKEKGRSGSKDRKKDKDKVSKAGAKEMIDENSTSSSTNHKRSYGQTPPLHSTQSASNAKATASTASAMNTAATHSKLSEDSSTDFDMDDDYPTTARPASPPPVKHEKPDVVNSISSEQSNIGGCPDVVTKVSPSHRTPLGESPTKQTKKSGKESKSKSLIAAAAASKEEFQVSSRVSFKWK